MTLNTILINNYNNKDIQIIKHKEPFPLECGQTLPELDIAFCTYGKLNKTRDNVVWVCHALTGNADAKDWWEGLIGEGKIFDPAKYFIVCANMLGSCYGATTPTSTNPATGKAYGKLFPLVTIKDIIGSHKILRKQLKIASIDVLIGGSMGGQQVLEWAIQEPQLIKKIIPVATNAKHSPWAIAFNESQRMALEADPTFGTDAPNAGHKGMEAARSFAILSYRHYITYDKSQKDTLSKMENYRASSYQKYQGVKLTKRFDPLAYYSLSKSMDSQDVGRGRGSVKKALKKIKAKTLVISIDTDILFPLSEQQLIAKHIKKAKHKVVKSNYGHDGFLIEYNQLEKIIGKFLNKK